MKLKWLGHACFLITSDAGVRIITDPYPQGSGLSYALVSEAADIAVVSHDHFDHNNVSSVPGKPEVVTSTKTVKGIQFKGVASHHDESGGKERGTNTIFCFTVDGIKLCHLGDLGHRLNKEQITEIGAVDVLLIPVGGVFTVDAKMAGTVSDDLNPKVVIPMHCKTPKCDWPLNTVDDFVAGKKNVKNLNSSEAEFRAGKLPDRTEIVILQPAM
ncbi:MAG: MBL fold metallo-hydrolase [Chloroflexi bacterium]|nr:MBL fold metallo-hydrolase [Chloroflexota bacterium]